MPVSRHKCHQCQKLIPKATSYIVLYDASTDYIYYFCSWWHLTKWYLLRWWRENGKRILASWHYHKEIEEERR